jgi:hypothetical protein
MLELVTSSIACGFANELLIVGSQAVSSSSSYRPEKLPHLSVVDRVYEPWWHTGLHALEVAFMWPHLVRFSRLSTMQNDK